MVIFKIVLSTNTVHSRYLCYISTDVSDTSIFICCYSHLLHIVKQSILRRRGHLSLQSQTLEAQSAELSSERNDLPSLAIQWR